ncbi:MAG: exodeoxyribonuclease I [Candidatus Nomurabacteria bacterium]|jgi:exodeoxyribonuclease-1|nr:exodeoxyribonuclease I [Candidatus Nomurabacteria bacterium]
MAQTLFFYDLETSGLNPRFSRVMQFAGQRTDLDLQPIDEPINIFVRLSEDILPSPSAIMVTGITPQQTLSDGLSEAEFAKFLYAEVFTPDTVAIGYNNIRFDDEFLRNTFWRNFHDPYEWQWSEGRSKWDLLDVVRLVRALRPDGIKWPFASKNGEKYPTNKLELLSKVNKLEHKHAHDALSDVEALIGMTRLIREKQPKIYDYLFENRGKKEVAKLVNLDNPQPFVYASGRYDTAHEKLAVAFPIAPGKNAGTMLVYNLLFDPTEFAELKDGDFLKSLTLRYTELESAGLPQLPIKELNFGRCPAIAPLGVLDEKSAKRLDINLEQVKENYQKLLKNRGIIDKMINAWRERPEYEASKDVEGKLYDSFIPDADKIRVQKIPEMMVEELADFNPNFTDERLPELLFRYKARSFPKSLSEAEQKRWQSYRAQKFAEQAPKYMEELQKLSRSGSDDFLLQELQLWAESIYPEIDE